MAVLVIFWNLGLSDFKNMKSSSFPPLSTIYSLEVIDDNVDIWLNQTMLKGVCVIYLDVILLLLQGLIFWEILAFI